MMGDVDIFVRNTTAIDTELYSLWLGGYSAHEATNLLQKRGVLQQYCVTADVLLSDILDHYRTFNNLERWLQHPTRLAGQLCYQIEPELRNFLIHHYYEFNDDVIRELLGKKLTSKQRKELDEVSEKTKVPLKSCRRQFDNVKHVFKTVEELKGSLVENIRANFLLTDELARKYAAIVFLANNRFETGKKRLLYLNFDDFCCCADLMIRSWSYSAEDCVDHEDMDVDFDVTFFHNLRDCKQLSDKELLEEHKRWLLIQLQDKLKERTLNDLDANYKTLTRVIVNIAINLIHGKQLRDFFSDLVEKVVDPFKQNGWTSGEMVLLMTAYLDTFKLTELRNQPTILKTWERYAATVAQCILRMYHS